MFTENEDGFELDFDSPEIDSPVAKALAIGLTKLMAAVWEVASVEPISARRAEEAKLSIRLVRLASHYVTETVACSEGRAWFAASIMGMAAMESILMLACIAEKSRVLTTQAWTSFRPKRQMTFRERLPHVDLKTFIEIAQELKWFPEDDRGIEDIKKIVDWGSAVEEYPEMQANPAQMITSSGILGTWSTPVVVSERCARSTIELGRSHSDFST
jgi:hypothetical protein